MGDEIAGFHPVVTHLAMAVGINLLDLPVELRLAVYEITIHGRENVTRGRFHSSAYLTSWCSLMLVCRQIAFEMRDYMAQKASKTWILELDNRPASQVPKPVRRSLPCSPTDLQSLYVDTALHTGSMPLTTALALDRIISVLVRSGPVLNADVQLLRPLRFNDVELAFSWAGLHNMRYGLPEKIVCEFRRIQRSSSNATHPLRSSIDNVKLVTDHYEQRWPLLGEDD